MTRRAITVAALAVSCLLLAGQISAQSCDAADAQLAAERLEQARDGYVAALTASPNLDCARAGLEQVARRYLVRAEEFLEVRLEDSARVNLIRTMAQSPNSESAWEAQRLLLDLGQRTARAREAAVRDSLARSGFAQARTLAALGLYTEARAAVVSAIAADPARRVPTELEYLVGGPSPTWRAFQRWIEPWIRFSPALAALVLVVVWLLASLLRKPRLTIDGFETESIREAPKIGGGFGVILGTQMLKLLEGDRDQAPRWVQAQVGTLTIPAEVQGLVPGGGQWVDGAVRILRWMEPRSAFAISGHLHESDPKGLGVTIQLRRGSKFITGTTIWLADLWPRSGKVDHKAGYPALAEAAAIWLLFNLPRSKARRPFRVLGTSDWLAFAYFRLAFHQQSEDDGATLFKRALQREPEFAAALSNLGTYFLSVAATKRGQRAERSDLERAHAFLSRALDVVEKSPADAQDPTRYVTLVSLVAACSASGDTAAAAAHATELQNAIQAAQRDRKGDPALQSYLRRMLPTVELMIAVLTRPEAVPQIAERHAHSPSANTQYSVASAWSILGSHAKTPEEAKKCGSCCLVHLERSFALDGGGLRQWATMDWSLDWVRTCVDTQAEFVALVAPPPQTPPRAPVQPLDAGAFSVPAEHLGKLVAQGITDWADLLLEAGTPQNRERLATALGVPVRLIERWAHVADLQRVVGLRAKDAGLLQLGGIETLHDLAGTKSEVVLHATLQAVAKTQATSAPPLEAVTRWIRDAGALPAKVV